MPMPMASLHLDHSHTTCASLLQQLQCIWAEVGESEGEREKVVEELERECVEVYKRKVGEASEVHLHFRQSLAEASVELSSLLSVLGEDDSSKAVQKEEYVGRTLREQLASIQPQLNELRRKKEDRVRQFLEVEGQIQKICSEISGSTQPLDDDLPNSFENENDLSSRRLDEYYSRLRVLQNEKNERLQKILDHLCAIRELCSVLGTDFPSTVITVHPSLDDSEPQSSINISDQTLHKLVNTVLSLEKEKSQRMQKLQDLGSSLIELWNLMGSSIEEQKPFRHITHIIRASGDGITLESVLTMTNIEQAEIEVKRLDGLKASRMKEFVMRKQTELEEICHAAHMDPDPIWAHEKIMATMDSGMVDLSELLASMEQMIARAKEEAGSRREILSKIERWIAACEEESWLEDYNRDENRYNTSRVAHVNLKRAEKARLTMNKIPALVESLALRIKGWEDERSIPFLYDGMRVLEMLDEYKILRHEREEEKRRSKDLKRLQGQLIAEQDTLFGSRLSPNKSLSNGIKGLSVHSSNGNMTPRRISSGGSTFSTGNSVKLVPRATSAQHGKDARKLRPVTPPHPIALSKDENGSFGSEPTSPTIDAYFP